MGDSGIKLSGGQRQRLGIARSLVKQPKILILDEATSSIDVRGEQIVQAALERVSKNRTTLVIAHRLGTVRKADNIIVLRKGKVVQQGTHELLMEEEGGAYWVLATAQQLAMAAVEQKHGQGQGADTDIAENKSTTTIGTESTLPETLTPASKGDPPKGKHDRGFWASFGLLLREQKHHRRWYAILLLGALGGGGKLTCHCSYGMCKKHRADRYHNQPVSQSRHTSSQRRSLYSSSGGKGCSRWPTFGV